MTSSLQSNAQQNEGLIKGLPQYNQGYLFWNDTTAGISFWRVEILNEKYVNDSTFDVAVLNRTELWDKNFLRIDKQYWNVDSIGFLNYAVLRGYDSNGNLIHEEKEVMEEGFPDALDNQTHFKGCSWDCVGDNYAYKIQQFRKITNPDMGHYSVLNTYDAYIPETGTVIPHYRYFDNEELSNYTMGFAHNPVAGSWWYDDYGNPYSWSTMVSHPHFHGVQDWLHTNNGNRLIKFDQYAGGNQGSYISAGGSLLTNTFIYGLQKYKGWWRQFGFYCPANPTQNSMFISGDCMNYRSWAVDKMNSSASNLAHNQNLSNYMPPDFAWYHPYGFPELQCNDPMDGIADDYPGDFNNCFYSQMYLNQVINDIENGPDWWWMGNLLGMAAACYELTSGGGGANSGGGSSGGGGVVGDVIASVEYMSLQKLNSAGSPNQFHVMHSDLIDSTGSPLPFNAGTINPGLYEFNFKLPGEKPTNIVFENKKPVVAAIPLKTYLTASVFPVPIIQDNQYSLHLTAAARLEFTYELRDSQGNLIFTQNFGIPKDHDANHTIHTDHTIPTGLLIHRFVFPDNSVISIPTLK